MNRMRLTFLTLLLAVMLAGCRGGASTAETVAAEGDTLTRHADLLTMVDCGDWTLVEMRDAWNASAQPVRLALVEHGCEAALPEGVARVEVPLQHAVVTSSVHLGALDELGRLDAVRGIADAAYITLPQVRRGIDEGSVADCGPSASPIVERIIAADADAVLAVPFAESDHSALRRMGIPVIEMADYMEPTPQGRAEWLRLIGRLFGAAGAADSLFAASLSEYERLKGLASQSGSRPKVITEQVQSGTWYVPGGRSYMARMLADAGAAYPFADDTSTGSLPMDFAAVYDRASDADFWLLKSFGPPPTLAGIKADNPLNARIKAWQTGNVYVANTAEVPLFEEFPFHPERLLADYILIFHPELADSIPPARYFHRID